ncbi:P-loop containing nucleoside triphosphate hydrolase protein [Gigaspora rosea]|uniref:DNA 3'-5' helicase n=1 Tax=Gigaspora rosea TaxID=44941 RepID=A0A397UNF2_9GLOM|nr:P-loop containing nucleoside triphosphate hydrolase protein [Gigaspora rosea]
MLLHVPDIDSNLQNKLLVPLIPGAIYLLGLTTTENVKCLHGYVGARYSNIFDLEHRQYKAKKEINSVIKLAKRDASSLESKIEQGIQTDLMLNLQKSDINSALIQTLELLEKESDNSSSDEYSDIESDQDETSNIQEIINLLITKGKLGSSLFVSTEIFLELILKQPCPKCYNIEIVTKKHQIIVSGFSVKINITCTKCSTTVFYKNEADGIDYSKLIASAGLVGGVNREEWVTILCACGVTQQSGKKQYFQKQEIFFKKFNFDNSWSHVREASQASGEFIYNGKIDGYRAKPIVGYHLVEKPRIYKNKKDETIVINEGNYDKSSRQMEHANLIADQPIVSKIFADLKHKSAIVRKKIAKNEKWKYLEQPIMNFYSRAVYAAYIRAGDNSYLLPTDNDLHKLHYDIVVDHLLDNHSRCWNEICWKVDNPDLTLPEPNLIENQNESVNRIKLNYTDKKQDYPKSYKTRHALAVIHNNNGILELLQILRQADQLQDFNWSQDLIPYGKLVQDNITKYTFQLSFSVLIPNFDSFILCEGCSSFPKRFLEQGLSLLEIFNLQNFKELQLESIESFISHKDTLTIIPTGGGKTLIFSIASILFYGLTVVFTPLKSVMEYQLRELINIGIPSAYLFAATDQPVDIQKKIFSEIASGLIKVLRITPEKFIQNFQFRQMLKKLAEIRSIQFIVDEAYCIKEYTHFRPAWNQLSQLKDEFTSVPILLTATCSEYIANQLAINLKCSHINIICNIQIYRPELNLQVLSKPAKKDKLLEAIFKTTNETSSERVIIYCSTPDECIDIMTAFKKQYNPDLTAIYHRKMSTTNAFGMGVHVPDVRVIIHATFPMSITNLVQEIGRAARDGNSEFSQHDDSIATIFESSYCFEDFYNCRQILYYTPFKWTMDPQIPECDKCDNCIKRDQDNTIRVNICNDLLKLLDITEKLLTMVEEKN